MNPTQNKAQPPAPPVDITPADTLRGAARYLELHGWIQGDYYSQDGNEPFPPACVLGAITMAVCGYRTDLSRLDSNRESVERYDRAVLCLANFLWTDGRASERDYEPDSGQCNTGLVSDWNDETGQTLADITDVLRAAADEYDWAHATEDDLETYADACVWNETRPTREGFLSWRAAR